MAVRRGGLVPCCVDAGPSEQLGGWDQDPATDPMHGEVARPDGPVQGRLGDRHDSQGGFPALDGPGDEFGEMLAAFDIVRTVVIIWDTLRAHAPRVGRLV